MYLIYREYIYSGAWGVANTGFLYIFIFFLYINITFEVINSNIDLDIFALLAKQVRGYKQDPNSSKLLAKSPLK